jgi:hypothetical protein
MSSRPMADSLGLGGRPGALKIRTTVVPIIALEAAWSSECRRADRFLRLGLKRHDPFSQSLGARGKAESGPAAAVERATVLVGPPLILTSLALACGFIVTVFSDPPSLRLFGWLSALAMLAALVADFLILRPTGRDRSCGSFQVPPQRGRAARSAGESRLAPSR